MEERNITNNLNIKGGRKIDCDAFPRIFLCYKLSQYRGAFLDQSKRELFVELVNGLQ